MPLMSRNPSEVVILVHEILSPPKRHQRRWRVAFIAISFTTALSSLLKTVVDNHAKPLCFLPHIAVNITSSLGSVSHLPSSSFDLKALAHLAREGSLQSLEQLGGVEQLVTLLESDLMDGINPNDQDDLAHRRRIFGANRCQTQSAKRFPSFFLEACWDMTTITLLFCAVMSLAFGIKAYGLKDGWNDFGSVLVAVFLVVALSAWSKFNQSRESRRLFDQRNDIKVQVVRGGRNQAVSIFDVVVGDVVLLGIGDQVPADGLFLDGGSLMIDESGVTGKTEQVEVNGSINPFFLSGTKVVDGAGRMLVTSVGMNTIWGEKLSSTICNLTNYVLTGPLQARVKKLSSKIEKAGFSVAALVLVAILIRYLTGYTKNGDGTIEFMWGKTKLIDVLYSIVGIVTASVSLSGSLSPAVWLILACSKGLIKDTAIVRNLSACEALGSSTTICTDKIGTLTLTKVTEFWVGKETLEDVKEQIEPALFKLLQEGIALNADDTVCQPHSLSATEISDSSMEKASLSWAGLDLGMCMNEIKSCEVLHIETFNSEKRRSGVLVRKSTDETVHSHWKGAPEMILAMCSNYHARNGEVKIMNEEEQSQFKEIVHGMAEKCLRCIAFAHKMAEEVDGQVSHKLEETGLTLMGLAGLEESCRPGTKTAVESCRRAGVSVKMVTGDNVHTARAIAVECGILTSEEDIEDKAVVEGTKFRNYAPDERMARIEDIRVMATSSPVDKLLMVQCLKEKGHVVAVTGDGTNDANALLEADIGLSMGIQGTGAAKGSSDIIILNGNFDSVVTVLKWGRCVHNNVLKFIQLQLTFNISALAINIIPAVSLGESPLTVIQQLWANLVMDTLGALALATEPLTHDLMTFPLVPRAQSLITIIMWRDAITQAIYQVASLTTLYFKGKSTFHVDENVNNTIMFNTFFLFQVFNLFNITRILDRKNVLKAIHKNKMFVATTGIIMVLQVLMVELTKRFSKAERLTWVQWGACFGIAATSWPIACIVKCISRFH